MEGVEAEELPLEAGGGQVMLLTPADSCDGSERNVSVGPHQARGALTRSQEEELTKKESEIHPPSPSLSLGQLSKLCPPRPHERRGPDPPWGHSSS